MALFDFLRPRWKRENPMQRYLGVKELHDQELLIEIAKNDEDYEIRMAAVSNIEDESVLAEIVKNETNRDVIYKAIEKINDESLLIDIYKNISADNYPREAIEKINDESFLFDVAKNGEWGLKSSAILRINDEDALVYLAKNGRKYHRKMAVKRLVKVSNLFENIASDDYVNILKEIEKLNYTTSSIYDLKEAEVLMISKNGHNYASWEEYYELISDKKEKLERQARIASREFITGGECDQFSADEIIFISENLKGTHKLPKYKRDCEYVTREAKLNPQTDRHTETQNYYLCRFGSLRAIVVIGLENPQELDLNDFSADIIVFKNCDFSHLDETNITPKDRGKIMIMGDESSIKHLMELLPDNCMYI
jgi:hypothetical protein